MDCGCVRVQIPKTFQIVYIQSAKFQIANVTHAICFCTVSNTHKLAESKQAKRFVSFKNGV